MMIIVVRRLLDVLDGGVLAPAELVRVGLTIGWAGRGLAIELVMLAPGLVVHRTLPFPKMITNAMILL